MTTTARFARASATAFAPATVANVSVGFDVLGFAVEAVGDTVTAVVDEAIDGVEIDAIEGVVTDLPRDAASNTATVAARALLDGLGLAAGVRLSLTKGIPLGSGMGGSAASAVAAVVAVNGLLADPLPRERLLGASLAGEAAASGAPHADNAAPCLFGGLVAAVSHDPPRVIDLPVPDGLRCVLVHPGLRIDTRDARRVLPVAVPLATHVEQAMSLAGFVAGCFRGDLELIGACLTDRVAEPRRAALIPGFEAARRGALAAGALGCGISGSGPTVFAWLAGDVDPAPVVDAMRDALASAGAEVRDWVTTVDRAGARIVEP